MAISAQFLTPPLSISTNFRQLQFPFNNSAAMLGNRPTTQLVKLFLNQQARSSRRYWQLFGTWEIVSTCDSEWARKLGAQTWYIVKPRPVHDNGRRIFMGSSVRGDGGEACVCIVESGTNGRAMAPCSSQHERHSQELCNAGKKNITLLILQGLGFKG